MKIKFGAIVTDGRGKIGGHVASKNRGGAYLRTKVTPSNPQTSFQNDVRNRLTNFSQGWRGLTQSQRNAWNSAVESFSKTNIFGDIKNPTGLQLYVKLNSNLDEAGEAAITVPPLPSSVEAVLTLSAVASAGGGTLAVTFTPTPVPADTGFLIMATSQVSPGKSFLKNLYRTVNFVAAAGTSPSALGALYIARFGTMVQGQKIGIGMQPVNTVTGQKGQMITYEVIVGA